MIAIALHQHHQINKPFKKSSTPKIKIPKQSKPPKCEKEKPMCEVKSNLKRKLENEEEVENKGFNTDGDMDKFLEHLCYHNWECLKCNGILIISKA